jgi:hypothetical protein
VASFSSAAGNIPTFEYYESPIQIDGTSYMAYIRVKNTKMGDKYYGHTISEVDHITVEPATRTPDASVDMPGEPEKSPVLPKIL